MTVLSIANDQFQSLQLSHRTKLLVSSEQIVNASVRYEEDDGGRQRHLVTSYELTARSTEHMCAHSAGS